ncbi:hypothetical protein HYALB_00013569 [Hymenoscyphus albidus]|uniref:RanBP2-type domain-containing protein n=1 Tax=Hymenoscyphus albidus TaxID=595503 RepID=A0A9N9LY16_9HELO|nr:hypothetical protein HYALB_00013569 [Hymenoscyphus albidus]
MAPLAQESNEREGGEKEWGFTARLWASSVVVFCAEGQLGFFLTDELDSRLSVSVGFRRCSPLSRGTYQRSTEKTPPQSTTVYKTMGLFLPTSIINYAITSGASLVNEKSCQNKDCTYNNPTNATKCEKCGADVI